MATQASPSVATQETKDSPHDSPFVSPTIEDSKPSLNRTNYNTRPEKKREQQGKKSTWLTPFMNAWRERYGGEPAAGPLAQAMKPLVEKHDAREALRRWEAYLSQTDPAYASPARFSSTFLSWEPKPEHMSDIGVPDPVHAAPR